MKCNLHIQEINREFSCSIRNYVIQSCKDFSKIIISFFIIEISYNNIMHVLLQLKFFLEIVIDLAIKLCFFIDPNMKTKLEYQSYKPSVTSSRLPKQTFIIVFTFSVLMDFFQWYNFQYTLILLNKVKCSSELF